MIDHGPILVIGAHPDDEVLGAGGTLATLAIHPQTTRVVGPTRVSGHDVHIALVTAGGPSPVWPDREKIRRQDATNVAANLQATLHCGEYAELYLKIQPVADWLRSLVAQIQPTVVLTHSVHDLHQDHRVVAEASIIACRPYEAKSVRTVLSYLVDPFEISARRPLIFSRLSQRALEIKMDCLRRYRTEVMEPPHPRSPEHVMDRARYFGTLIGCDYAEPFDVIRGTLL